MNGKTIMICVLVVVGVLIVYNVLRSEDISLFTEKNDVIQDEEIQEIDERKNYNNSSVTSLFVDKPKTDNLDSDASTESDKSDKQSAEDEIKTVAREFLIAQYNYSGTDQRLEAMKLFITVDLLNMFDNPTVSASSGRGDGEQLTVTSTVTSIEIYDITEHENKVVVVARVKYDHEVEGAVTMAIDIMATLDLIKDTGGNYLVNAQEIKNIQ